MKFDRTLVVNALASLVLTFVVYVVYQFTGEMFAEGNLVLLFLLFLIFLEIERKKR